VVDFGSRKKVSPRWGLWVVRGAFPGLTPPGYWLSPRWGLLVVGVCRSDPGAGAAGLRAFAPIGASPNGTADLWLGGVAWGCGARYDGVVK